MEPRVLINICLRRCLLYKLDMMRGTHQQSSRTRKVSSTVRLRCTFNTLTYQVCNFMFFGMPLRSTRRCRGACATNASKARDVKPQTENTQDVIGILFREAVCGTSSYAPLSTCTVNPPSLSPPSLRFFAMCRVSVRAKPLICLPLDKCKGSHGGTLRLGVLTFF